MVNRHRLEQHRVDQAENGSVGADAQRQRKDGRGNETGATPKGAQSVAQILRQAIE